MIRSILEHAGIPTGLIGTIEVIIGDRHIPAHNTTPESYEVQEYFAQMVEAGCKVVVMEVSSQGLKLHRTAGIQFDIGIFTNLAPDHIGENEHASFEEYMECKSRLFRQCDLGHGQCGRRALRAISCRAIPVGWRPTASPRKRISGRTDLKLVNRPGFLGVDYHVSGLMDFDVEIDMPGRFSVYNSLVAIAVCRQFDIPKEDMLAALEVVQTKGRIEKVKVSDDFTLMIDYAHNAMSLESLLTTLKEYKPEASGLPVWLRRQPFQAAPVRDGRGVRQPGGSDRYHLR